MAFVALQRPSRKRRFFRSFSVATSELVHVPVNTSLYLTPQLYVIILLLLGFMFHNHVSTMACNCKYLFGCVVLTKVDQQHTNEFKLRKRKFELE